MIDGISPIAGKYPIWLNVPEEGHFLWQNMGLFLPPPEGRETKQLWAIADDIQGKVRITGNQLDGNGVVLFPKRNSVEWVNDTTVKYIEKPLDTLIIDTSSANGRVTSPKPKSYTYFGSDMIYPHPGCYQFTASIDQNTVNIVVELLDK